MRSRYDGDDLLSQFTIQRDPPKTPTTPSKSMHRSVSFNDFSLSTPSIMDEEGFEGLDKFSKDFRVVATLDTSSLTQMSTTTTNKESYSSIDDDGGESEGDNNKPTHAGNAETNSQQKKKDIRKARRILQMSQDHSSVQFCKEELLLVEDYQTSKRFNARKLSFISLADANDSYCDHWRFMRFMQQHENLVGITKIYVEQCDVYIVKERFTDNLVDYIAEKRGGSSHNMLFSHFPEEIVVGFMSQISAAISHLHSRGYTHGIGELSPQNVFITDMYSRLLLEVGKSTNVFNVADIQNDNKKYLKSPFIAPEIRTMIKRCEWSKCINTEKADIFVLGIFFFVLMTLNSDIDALSQIFCSENYLELVKKQLSKLGYSEKILSLTLKCLSDDASKRPSSIRLHKSLSKVDANIQAQKETKLGKLNTSAATEKEKLRPMSILNIFSGKRKDVHTIADKSMKVKESGMRIAEGCILRKSKALHQGILCKQNKLSKWQERWYYLSDYNYLYCCRYPNDPTSVTHKTKLAPDGVIVSENPSIKNAKGFTFKLITEDDTVILSAPTEESRAQWISALKNIPKVPRVMPQSIDISQPIESCLLESDQQIEEVVSDEYTQRFNQLKQLNVRMIDYKDVTIINKIALGGFGQVFLVSVFDPATKTSCKAAMKSMLDTDMEKDEFEDFLNEVRIMSTLDHPNILPLVGVCCDRERLCIFSQYMNRGGMNDMLKNQKLSLRQRIELLYQVTQGMTYLHSREPAIIHRDLKPENLLMDDKLRVVISDFGLSRLKTKTIGKTAYVSTWNYMPPEKMKAPEEDGISEDQERIEEAGDVYSFAVIMYEAITLQPVFPKAKFPMQIANLVGRGERPKFPTFEEVLNADIVSADDKELYDLLQKTTIESWSQDPMERLSFAEINQVLREQCEQ